MHNSHDQSDKSFCFTLMRSLNLASLIFENLSHLVIVLELFRLPLAFFLLDSAFGRFGMAVFFQKSRREGFFNDLSNPLMALAIILRRKWRFLLKNLSNFCMFLFWQKMRRACFFRCNLPMHADFQVLSDTVYVAVLEAVYSSAVW